MDIGTLIVVTGSMEPTINIKEMIIIKKENDYKVGDIVTYRDIKKNLVTHRIVSKNGKNYITRGDNNTISDKPISLDRIEGKICYHSIVLGEFFLYWVKPILIIVIMVWFVSSIKNKILLRRVKSNETQI